MYGGRLILATGLALVATGCGGFDRQPLDAGTVNNNTADAGFNGMPSRNILVRTVLDGDTLIVSANATVRTPDGRAMDGERIRLIGVDAPEIAHPPADADCWGDEAHEFTRDTVGGRIVTLDWDPTHCAPPGSVAGCRDDFDRLLAYVLVGDTVLNEALLSAGSARVFRGARFQHRDSARYSSLESEAKRADLGLWSCP